MSTANLSRLLVWNRRRRADKEALIDGDLRLTYAELDDEVHAMAAGLSGCGIERGDVVAVLGDNSWRYVVEMLALSRLGAAFLPLNWRLHVEELSYIVDHSGAVGLIADAPYHDKAMSIASGCSHLHTLISNSDAPARGWETYDTLAGAGRGRHVEDADMGPDDLQRILYTSGTTSRPKGVMITHGNVIWNQLGQILELELSAADRILASAPFFHVSGLDVPGLTTLYIGATMVLTPTYRGAEIVELIEREQITGMVLAAQIVHDIRALGTPPARLASVRWIISGGMPPATMQQVQAEWAHVRMVDCYGMTELTNGATYMDAAHARSKVGSQGAPFPHVDLRIVDDEGRSLPSGTVGEIVVRGPKVTPGYWRDPEATAATRRDGWFHTGDLASIDDEGYLWFADRKKDMIKSGGENVASLEIEEVLARHPQVLEVAVVGVPDDRWDEVPKGFAVVAPGSSVTGEELREHCAASLGKFKVPREIDIVEDLPRNDSGKVLKRVLRDREWGRETSTEDAV